MLQGAYKWWENVEKRSKAIIVVNTVIGSSIFTKTHTELVLNVFSF